MQRFPQGLFKPGDLPLAGLMLSCLQVNDERELAAALADGWFECPNAAAASAKPAEAVDAQPTRAELEQKATELGIKFDGRTGDKTLADRIAAKLAAG